MAIVTQEPRTMMVGERCSRTVRFSREDIALFARLTGDSNPLHHDQQVAARARFGEIIASGQQTTSQMIGLAASHFSRRDDGIERELLCLNFNFAFKLPVFADQELVLQWTVASIEASDRLGGLIGHIDGIAAVRRTAPRVIGRGTILVRHR